MKRELSVRKTDDANAGNLPVPAKNLSTVLDHFSEGGSKYSDFLPGALAVTEKAPADFAKRIIYITAAFLLAVIIWSCFSSADRIVVGQGRVRPAGQVQIINHPAGGTVSAIYVKQGDRVTKGQKLLTIDPAIVQEDISKLTFQYNSLRAEVARLEAETGKRSLSFPPDLIKDAPDIVATQRALYDERMGGTDQLRQSLVSNIQQQQGSIEQYQARISNGRRTLELAEQQAAAARELEAKGYYPKLRVLQIERDVTNLRSDIEQAQGLLAGAEAAVREAQAKLGQMNRDTKSKSIEDLTLKRSQLAQIKSDLDKNQSVAEKLDLASPVDGYVEKMDVNNVGQAVGAGRDLMHIIPEDQDYIVEVAVKNRDIGFIHEGQEAQMKLQAYDYQRYGKLTGKVVVVPTDGVPNEKTNELMFTVQVKPDHAYLADDPSYRIRSGMMAETDFHVGKRTLMGYVIDTIMRTRDDSFRE